MGIRKLDLTVSGVTVTVTVGRQAAFCSHKDLISAINDPTTFCNVQGGYSTARYFINLAYFTFGSPSSQFSIYLNVIDVDAQYVQLHYCHYTNTHTHARTHARTHTHTHTHTHTQHASHHHSNNNNNNQQ